MGAMRAASYGYELRADVNLGVFEVDKHDEWGGKERPSSLGESVES